MLKAVHYQNITPFQPELALNRAYSLQFNSQVVTALQKPSQESEENKNYIIRPNIIKLHTTQVPKVAFALLLSLTKYKLLSKEFY